MSFERYRRQILIDRIGVEGQKKLKNARIGIVGAGGLGSFIILEAVAAGIGTVRIFEGDNLTLNNLNRQILYTEKDVGKKKAKILPDRVGELNSEVKIEVIDEMVVEEKQIAYFKDLDLIIDATDNIKSKLLLDKFSSVLGIPLVHGAVHGFRGQVGVFIYPRTLKQVYNKKLPAENETPAIASLCGVVGSLQVNEALRYILTGKTLLNGKLLLIDLWNLSFTEVEVE